MPLAGKPPRAGSAGPRGGGRLLQWVLLAAGALLVFGSFNRAVMQKEMLLREGQVLRLALAPVDPRALMTGDYMALDYAIAAPVAGQLAGRDGFAVLAVDDRHVGRLVRVQEAAVPVGSGELALRARSRGGRARIGTDAWYFQEGHAQRYAAAKYGEFRVAASGEALLVGLLDEALRPLAAGPTAAAPVAGHER